MRERARGGGLGGRLEAVVKLGGDARYTEFPFTPQFACANGLMTDEPRARSIAVYT